jgi:N-acetylglucosamine-6-phosphate deacetylase
MNSPAGEITAWHFASKQPVRLRWADGKITQIEIVSDAPPGLWVAPALLDLQINGYGGVDFQQDDLTVEDLLSAVRRLRKDGCARFLLTLITDEWPSLTRRLQHLRALRSQSAELAGAIVGWHIEGPFLSVEPGFHGAHNPSLMRDPAPEHILELRALTGADPLLLTVAPERPGVLKAIELAVSHGIQVSLGHTNASFAVLHQAVQAGATSFTHLGNGCPRELDRHDNILWRVFETPGLTVGLMHRLLPPDSIYYTTDAMAAAGMPPGRYKLAKMELEVGLDQVVRQPGKALFAGSALRPIDAISRAARMLRCPWQQVWPRFSEIPARLLGLNSGLAVGQSAAFCLIHNDKNNEIDEIHVGP